MEESSNILQFSRDKNNFFKTPATKIESINEAINRLLALKKDLNNVTGIALIIIKPKNTEIDSFSLMACGNRLSLEAGLKSLEKNCLEKMSY